MIHKLLELTTSPNCRLHLRSKQSRLQIKKLRHHFCARQYGIWNHLSPGNIGQRVKSSASTAPTAHISVYRPYSHESKKNQLTNKNKHEMLSKSSSHTLNNFYVRPSNLRMFENFKRRAVQRDVCFWTDHRMTIKIPKQSNLKKYKEKRLKIPKHVN